METHPANTADGKDPRNGARTVNTARDLPRPDATGEWPTLPPVPRPNLPPAYLGPEPPIIVGDAHLITALAPAVPLDPVPARGGPTHTSTRPTTPALVPARFARVPLRVRAARRPVVLPSRAENQVWQPRFAYRTAAVMTAGFALVAAPLWVVLYRLATAEEIALAQIVPLGMMLLGGFLTAVIAWVLIVEMRARVRVVDMMSRTGAHEAPGAAGASAFAGLLRPFIQIPAQVALLAVALSLFVGATVIAL